MDGFYSIWSKPGAAYNVTGGYSLEDYELLTLFLSALEWKKNNGNVYLYCDSVVRDYLLKNGFNIFFDEIYNLEVPEGINPVVFWAAGKIVALNKLEKNAVMLDLDLIVWKNMDDYYSKGDVLCIHSEDIRPEIYPDYSFFSMNKDYVFPIEFQSGIRPVNTAFLYIKDDEFRKYYSEVSIDFMCNCCEKHENLKHMVFAEQRLISLAAAHKGKNIYSIFDNLTGYPEQDLFTHIWGHKNILKYNYSERTAYCKRVLSRIKNDFYQSFSYLSETDIFKNYI